MVKDPQAKIKQKKNWDDYFLLTLKSPNIAREAKPGQFVMVKVNSLHYPLLRRPFSIHSREKDNIEIFFQKSGIGTKLLADKEPGETVDLLGPLGKGFCPASDLKGKNVVLVGGGRGIAPLYFLSQQLETSSISVKVFYGGKSLKDICLKEKFEKTSVELFCSTEDGTSDFKGRVTELLEEKIEHFIPDYLFTCGPEAMLERIAHITKKLNLQAEFSLESIMGCGFGACWGCVRKIKRNHKVLWLKICEEGPIFSREEIIW